MEFKVTKIQKYGKCIYQSEWIGTQYYYIVNIRVYTDETRNRYYKLHFIMMFDSEDISEYFGREYDDNDISEYKKDIAFINAQNICEYSNNIQSIAKECNATIERHDTYNLVARYNI